MSVDTSIVTNQDIKSAAKTSIISKWQQCWVELLVSFMFNGLHYDGNPIWSNLTFQSARVSLKIRLRSPKTYQLFFTLPIMYLCEFGQIHLKVQKRLILPVFIR